jgi:hypothetical protein
MARTRLPILVAVLALALLAVAAGALAKGGPPVYNKTIHFTNETETFTDVDPCTGQPAQITLTYSGVEHATIQPDGRGHFTETSRGSFSIDLLPPDGKADATGTFVDWDGGNGFFDQDGNPIGKAELTFTLNGRGTRSDGTDFHFHNSGHVVTDADAAVKVAFFKAHCG